MNYAIRIGLMYEVSSVTGGVADPSEHYTAGKTHPLEGFRFTEGFELMMIQVGRGRRA
jgi:hypothetical protein